MFKSELAEIIKNLEGYKDDEWFEVIGATKDLNDDWVLTVRTHKDENAEAENENLE